MKNVFWSEMVSSTIFSFEPKKKKKKNYKQTNKQTQTQTQTNPELEVSRGGVVDLVALL